MKWIKSVANIFLQKASHSHHHRHVGNLRHYWGTNENGKDFGMCSQISELIEMRGPQGRYPDQESLIWLINARSCGFNACRASWKVLRCNCGDEFRVEFYEHQFVRDKNSEDGSVINKVVAMVF